MLENLSFKDVILTGNGHEICSNLASALIQRYIEDNSTTDAISKRLVDLLSSIFNSENASTAHEKNYESKRIGLRKRIIVRIKFPSRDFDIRPKF